MSGVWGRLASRGLRLYGGLGGGLGTRPIHLAPPLSVTLDRVAFPRGCYDRHLCSNRQITPTPTVSGAGVIGAGEHVSTGPGAIPVGYIDDYHNHDHRNTRGDPTKRAFTYMVLGTTKFIAASAARVLVLKLIYTMSASADVLAKGSVEVDLTSIPLGTTATLKWRGKPVFIRHRTTDEIALAAKDDNADLRDPQADIDRVTKPEWLIVLGVCTHLGCVPIAGAGDYKGWFCPCHGSHYDVSGRTRKGPAPLNLEVPTYRFVDNDAKLILG
jgi:ubiquinol-cytochrome c reductase iron-sulfur subunit